MEKTMGARLEEKKRARKDFHRALLACIEAEQAVAETRRVRDEAKKNLDALEVEEQRPDRWE